MIPGSASAQFFAAGGTAAGEGPYTIERSLRFNSADSAYLNRTPASASNRKTWTWAGWVKRSKFDTYQTLFGAGTGGATEASLRFNTDNTIEFYAYTSGYNARLYTTQVFRDASAWYHVVAVFDTTNATADQRIRLYVNGLEITTFSNRTNPTQNYDGYVNNSISHTIGDAVSGASPRFFDGYLVDVHFIDGQALDPTSFGEFDTNGVWQPKSEVNVNYGVNGFHLLFSDNSSVSSLGTDTSGKDNNWTVNNIAPGSGLTRYSPFLTPSVGSWYETNTSKNAFNGALNPYAVTLDTSTINFAPTTSIPITSSLRLWYPTHGGFEPTKTATIDGVSSVATSIPNGGYWHDCTELVGKTISTSTPLSITASGGGRAQCSLTGVEVDGVLLVDPFETDSLKDVPVNGTETDTGAGGEVRGNYATMNPLFLPDGHTFTQGNLTVTTSTGAHQAICATFAISSGKWYWEYVWESGTSGNLTGIWRSDIYTIDAYVGSPTGSYSYYSGNGYKYAGGADSAYGATFAVGDVIGVAFDADSGSLSFYKNGVSQGVAFNTIPVGSGQSYYPAFSKDTAGTNTTTATLNFGQRPFIYQNAGTNRPAATYKALCTANLTTPTIADGSTAMDVKLWTGTGATNAITGLGFSPDMVWIKKRSDAADHNLVDSVRVGARPYLLYPNLTNAENTSYTLGVQSLDSAGFTLGTDGDINGSGATYAGWCWDAGSSTVTNTSGSISSQVRANASAGFSIVTYTGNGTSGATVGHGLGVAPDLVIAKRRSSANDWWVYHRSLGGTKYLVLNLTNAAGTASTIWNDTNPSSTVVTLGGGESNTNTATYVAYCFAPVAGYSAFGSYTGNGSSDGPFVYTGHRSRWIMVKRTDSAIDWIVIDTARSDYNQARAELYPNDSAAEGTNGGPVDINSNGFKVRTSSSSWNASGGTYIFASFASHPFQTARAR